MGKELNVYVIDDDSMSVHVVKYAFKKINFPCEITSFPLASEALEFLLNNPSTIPDLILLDINMPIMNAWEFLDKYLENKLDERKTKLVILSTSVFDRDKDKVKYYPQVSEFFEKPLDIKKAQLLVDKYFTPTSK
ncbi:MAG: response regulator [Cyclobacteriaceae bacterium]|nr:response regulator [Cyclobacteriaceae bacterium]